MEFSIFVCAHTHTHTHSHHATPQRRLFHKKNIDFFPILHDGGCNLKEEKTHRTWEIGYSANQRTMRIMKNIFLCYLLNTVLLRKKQIPSERCKCSCVCVCVSVVCTSNTFGLVKEIKCFRTPNRTLKVILLMHSKHSSSARLIEKEKK